jgi:lysophospholipid acyltransferase (LPLAT)-like uncharacterized protein
MAKGPLSPALSPQRGEGEPKPPRMVTPQPLAWYNRLAASMVYGLIEVVSFSLRMRWAPGTRLENLPANQPAILCTWHNRLALSLIVYRRYLRRPQQGHRLAAIVSASKDGGVVARILEHFGVQPVRGSTSRRGPQALLELTSCAEQGYDLAITPDGPRGPRYVVQPGVVSLAQLTGLPIVPMCWHLQWKTSLKSWDGFQIPLPFSRGTIHWGEPVYVPREASDQEREAARIKVEEQLRQMTVD